MKNKIIKGYDILIIIIATCVSLISNIIIGLFKLIFKRLAIKFKKIEINIPKKANIPIKISAPKI